MFRPMVCRIVAVVLAAPAIVVATAAAAAASQYHPADTHHHATVDNAWHGHDTLTWYRARTADADALGAHTSTVTAVEAVAYDHGSRAEQGRRQHTVEQSNRQTPRASGATELVSHSSDSHLIGGAYHQTGAQADAWGASTSRTDAVMGDRGGHGYVWMDQSGASANAWGADAGRTNGYATWRHDNRGGGGLVGYSSSSAHAGYDGARAGDIDAGAAYGY
jgi:hypothetical protein